MSGVIAGIGVAVAAAGAVAAHVQANQTAAAQRGEAGQAANAAAAAGTPQQATTADTSQTNSVNGPAAAGVNSGPSSTLLTGAGGVDANAIKTATGAMGLGSNTLLGS